MGRYLQRQHGIAPLTRPRVRAANTCVLQHCSTVPSHRKAAETTALGTHDANLRRKAISAFRLSVLSSSFHHPFSCLTQHPPYLTKEGRAGFTQKQTCTTVMPVISMDNRRERSPGQESGNPHISLPLCPLLESDWHLWY